MRARTTWIASCGLAVIGAFFIVLRVAWLGKVDTAWLPYVAHALGAMSAGLALARVAPPRAWTDAIAGGALGIVILSAVAFGLPSAFGWVAARHAHPWLVAAGIAAASGLACGLGAWFGTASSTTQGTAATATVAVAITACVVLLGSRVAVAVGLPASETPVMVFTCVAGFAAAFATQAVVPARRIFASSCGVPFLVALQLVEMGVQGRLAINGSVLLMAIPWLGALVGAHAAANARSLR